MVLRDCTKFWVGITGLKNPIGDPHIIYRLLRVSATEASFWLAHLCQKVTSAGVSLFTPSVVMCAVLTKEIVKHWHYGDEFLFVIIYYFIFFSVSG